MLALVFIGMLVWVALNHGRPLSWDRSLHAAALRDRTHSLIAAAEPISVGVEVVAYAVSAVGGALLLRSWSWWRGALAGIGTLIVGQVLRVGVAALIARDRPPRADWAATAAGYSFPSGHTASATLAAGLLCLGLLRAVRSDSWRIAGLAVAICWAILDGVSRVLQGVHWPSDVLAGWVFGSALILLVAAVLATDRVRSWTTTGQRRPWRPAGRQEGRSTAGDQQPAHLLVHRLDPLQGSHHHAELDDPAAVVAADDVDPVQSTTRSRRRAAT